MDMDMDAMIDMVFDMETQDPDDFLCLLFLASHPRVRLKAVTLVPGSQEQVGLVRWALERLGVANVAIGAGNIAHEKPSVSPWHWRAFGGSERLRSGSLLSRIPGCGAPAAVDERVFYSASYYRVPQGDLAVASSGGGGADDFGDVVDENLSGSAASRARDVSTLLSNCRGRRVRVQS